MKNTHFMITILHSYPIVFVGLLSPTFQCMVNISSLSHAKVKQETKWKSSQCRCLTISAMRG